MQADNPPAQAAGLARLSLDKQYHGALQGSGQGEMLAGGDGKQNGAYVAVEKFDGQLDGRHGSFMLVHHALMDGGVPRDWMVQIIPGSGSGELVGISGRLRIEISDGKHEYELDYALPESP
ncbi:MAG: DUF3224 domain-containing protein [Lysobacterales bacterium]